ncbi:MAG: hypothetical protein AVDCRST_MAG07-2316, partial [uncultured Frankineae bacterium]
GDEHCSGRGPARGPAERRHRRLAGGVAGARAGTGTAAAAGRGLPAGVGEPAGARRGAARARGALRPGRPRGVAARRPAPL